jgi:hypothetical protein
MRRIIQTVFIIQFLFLNFQIFAQSSVRQMTREEYIETYKDMAIREMYEFGIPASIKLAQAVLESGNGNSKLAREGNNHFGIKCHGWQGNSMKVDDDAPQECFRVYDNADQSYKDHSAFLTTRPRYNSLFELETTDYKGWAHGLKKAGYATNPRYAELVIKIIEDHRLYKYDVSQSVILAAKKSGKKVEDPKPAPTVKPVSAKRQVLTNNDRKYIIARKDDDFFSLAKEFNIYSYQIWKYNELTRNDKLREGEMVYLEKKKGKASVPFHTVSKGENMRALSQLYGIRLDRLYRLNRIIKGDEPRIGQVLWLQERKPKE